MKFNCAYDELVDLEKLVPNPKNNNKHPKKQIERLASDFYGIEYPLGGGTIHGKDLSKADCSVNIYCFVKAQETGKEYKAICSIGDEKVNVNGELVDFSEIVEVARDYINKLGGFEKLAEWGLR